MKQHSDMDTFLSLYANEFIQIRRQLHQLAELATLEHRTGRYLRGLLEFWGIPYQYPVAETGLTATILGKAPGSGKTVALRADMDALPIFENPHAPFSSQNPGVMHACGHDAHMAIALGVARYFKLKEDSFSGCVRIFFEPAEETIGGAEPMIRDGCMDTPPVDQIIGLHVAPYLPTGTIEVKYGSLYAASDEVTLSLQGKSSHGAYPDTGVDAIVMAGALISSLQSVISRNISPLSQCVLTFGTIHGGSTRNVLAHQVELTGTLRTTSPAVRSAAKTLIERQVQGIAHAYGGTGLVTFAPGYDALINTDELVDVLRTIALPILGTAHVLWKETPGMGVEDFSAFLKKAPGVFYHLGCGNEKKGLTAPLHSREFSLDEDCLTLGIRLQAALAEALLQ